MTTNATLALAAVNTTTLIVALDREIDALQLNGAAYYTAGNLDGYQWCQDEMCRLMDAIDALRARQ